MQEKILDTGRVYLQLKSRMIDDPIVVSKAILSKTVGVSNRVLQNEIPPADIP
jgi:hypothetical protein